jgi:hypothetical protein
MLPRARLVRGRRVDAATCGYYKLHTSLSCHSVYIIIQLSFLGYWTLIIRYCEFTLLLRKQLKRYSSAANVVGAGGIEPLAATCLFSAMSLQLTGRISSYDAMHRIA